MHTLASHDRCQTYIFEFDRLSLGHGPVTSGYTNKTAKKATTISIYFACISTNFWGGYTYMSATFPLKQTKVGKVGYDR